MDSLPHRGKSRNAADALFIALLVCGGLALATLATMLPVWLAWL